jgi:hydroxypyruvate isomerase
MSLNRRSFVTTGAAAAAALASSATPILAAQSGTPGKFRLKYAPHFGMFRNSAPGGPIEELKFIADQGFRAIEDNGMKSRSVEDQEKIAAEMTRLGLEMGVFVAAGSLGGEPAWTSGKKDLADRILEDMKASVEVAKRVNAKWCTVVPGILDPKLPLDYQTANVIELLRRCCEICEKTGLVMVLESLNRYTDHPGLFLWQIPQAYMICRAVNHPSCKILFDMYHQQITEGNIIPNIDRAWSEIGYFQTGDNPGRKEPGTGEMNYKNIFKHIAGKSTELVIGMEHGNSKPGKEGEQAVIAAYREADTF